MTTMVTRVLTWLKGERVGTDSFGNSYYQERAKPARRRRRRWVVYKQEDEASRVPPSWHAWLHYTTDRVPDALVHLLRERYGMATSSERRPPPPRSEDR